MTDQAQVQSGSDAAASPADLSALIKQSLTGVTDPKGQPESAKEQAQPTDGGESSQPESAADMFKVPALEGDGYEELTADELRKQRLMHKDYTQKTQQLAEERKRIDALKAEATQAMTAKLERLDYDIQSAARLIQSFEQNIDWNRLRQEDPAMYLEQREAQAQRIRQWEEARKTAETLKAEQRKARRATEAQRLIEAVPDWLDPVKAKTETQQILDGAAQYGLTAEDIENFDDHRLILVLRDALQLRQTKEKAAAIKAEVSKAPQMAKPGTAQQGNPQALATHRAINTARQTGDRDALRSAFAAMLKQSERK